MKNTKRLLVILCAMAVLSAMIFSFAVSAADSMEENAVQIGVVANQGTSISEYFDMKKITEYGFEISEGTNTLFNGKINNGGTGGVYDVNNVWTPASPIYGNDLSTKFFAIDFSTNTGNPRSHYYIQPVLAQAPGTANIEKSPIYGFVAEFDIAFLSSTEPVKIQYEDPVLGLAYEDENGTVVYLNGEDYCDENGRVAWKDPAGITVYEQDGSLYLSAGGKGDRKAYVQADKTLVYMSDAGNFYNADGTMVRGVDEENIKALTTDDCVKLVAGHVVPHNVTEMVPLLDDNGNEVKDANGNTVMVENVNKTDLQPLGGDFSIQMLNTSTVQDGVVNVMSLSIDSKGIVSMKCNNQIVHTASVDEWQHITIQYDADSMLTQVYVGRDDDVYTDPDTGKQVKGRKLLYQFSAYDSSKGLVVYPLAFRLGASSLGGLVAFDNFLAYQGKTIHNPDLLSDLTEMEQFLYISNLLANEENTTSALVAYQSYEFIKENFIDTYCDSETGEIKPGYISNESIVSAVDLFNRYKNDTDGLMTALKKQINIENRDKYIYYVENAISSIRTIYNSTQRDTKITAAEKFLSSAGSSIEKDDLFYTYQQKLEEYSEYARLDANANEFVTYMNLFDQSVKYSNDGGSVSLNRLQSHYDKAKVYYDLGISNYTDFDANSTDADVKNSYENLKKAIESYETALSKIESKTTTSNGERFVGIVNTMKDNSCGNWANDGVEVENLWKMAFDILYENNYDTSVPGMSEAKAVYNSANNYFYKKMQREHKDILKEKLDGFNSAASYVDKAAICTYVERYIEVNQKYIDMDDLELKGLVTTTESYKAQLGTVEADYANLLVQNTIEFVNTMKYADMFDSYTDLKPLYLEATSFYYAMNFKSDSISEEEIELYVVKYELLRDKIIAIETSCEIFLNNAEKFSGGNFDTETVYKALAECCEKIDDLDETYEGITEAKALFDAKYNEYMSFAGNINDQIEKTANAACALRGNWDFDSIVSYFKSIFN